MRAALTATTLALCAASCAAARDAPTPQLNLQPCNSTAQTAALSWAYAGGAFSLRGSTPLQCATYDPGSTNLVMSACASLPTQAFTLRADGTIFSPSTGQCWDSQYYSNSTGGGLGLYTCEPGQHWDLFAYDSTTGLLTYNSTPGLCVSGGFPPPPLPTAQQLAWMDTEVSLMISFDIVTSLTEVPNPQHFCIQAGGDSGFPVPPASRFAPSSDVDFTQSWMAAAAAADARYTLLVASHCSGFFQWQSNVTLPDGTPYPYTVAQSAWKGGKGDVVSDYVAASRAAGLPFGFYLTWNYNYLFNRGPSGEAKTPLQPGQMSVSDEQYHAMMLAQMEEVWTRYPGAITEIWCVGCGHAEASIACLARPTLSHAPPPSPLLPSLSPSLTHTQPPCRFDGGENNDAMNALIQRLQPQAIAADGTQAPNVARLVGGESGYAPYPVWSTTNRPAEDGSGDMMGAYFCPAECVATSKRRLCSCLPGCLPGCCALACAPLLLSRPPTPPPHPPLPLLQS